MGERLTAARRLKDDVLYRQSSEGSVRTVLWFSNTTEWRMVRPGGEARTTTAANDARTDEQSTFIR